MKFYISTKGVKRLTISSAGAGKSPTATSTSTAAIRRVSIRTVFLAVLVLALLLPFVFVRVAFLVLESATLCSSDSDCLGWRFFSGTDASLGLSEELTRALVEAKEGGISLKEEDGRIMESSFNELVKEMTSTRQDIKAFAFKTKAMLSMMEQKVQKAKRRESIYWHLASHGVPKSLHCLCLKLAEEYAVNALARSRLPSPEHVSRLSDPSYHHIALLTDNVLAASVVISSTLQNSANPEKLVFHIVTDKKTYTPMHAWFALNSVSAAVVEVKGLHQYDWSDQEVNTGVKETLEIHRLIWSRYYSDLKVEDLHEGEYKIHLDSLSPSCLSLMNHLRIYLPELFPDLGKILLLDDDVVVQRDISPLWDLDLEGNVISAAMDSWCREKYYCCHGRKYKEYMNFSQPDISSSFDPDDCAWLYGMNVFDLDAWRRSNITSTYHHWLKLNLNSGFGLWQPGELPPSLIAFTGQVHRMDPSWHVAGLGNRAPHEFPDKEILESAAVIHFSGPAKPWLEIGSPEVRSLWNRHVNLSHKFVKRCRILG